MCIKETNYLFSTNDLEVHNINRTTKKSSLFGIDISEKGMINCDLEHVMHVIDNAVNEVI